MISDKPRCVNRHRRTRTYPSQAHTQHNLAAQKIGAIIAWNDSTKSPIDAILRFLTRYTHGIMFTSQ